MQKERKHRIYFCIESLGHSGSKSKVCIVRGGLWSDRNAPALGAIEKSAVLKLCYRCHRGSEHVDSGAATNSSSQRHTVELLPI
jgi:hypothetical protein